MHILIPIPIGTTHVAAIQGTAWKLVTCEGCQQQYAYLLELNATGEHHYFFFQNGSSAQQQAQANAEQNLKQKSHNIVLPVPCPACGIYQWDMVKLLKEEASLGAVQMAGSLVVMLAFLPLVFDIPFKWAITLVLATVGLSLLLYGYVIAFRRDPNAGDSAQRKALGQKHAIAGYQLKELLARKGKDDPGNDLGVAVPC